MVKTKDKNVMLLYWRMKRQGCFNEEIVRRCSFAQDSNDDMTQSGPPLFLLYLQLEMEGEKSRGGHN